MSATLKVSNKLKSWKTKPRLSRLKAEICLSEIFVRSFPSNKTSPLVGLSNEARIFKSVVFPLPDSPIIAIYSPSSTSKETSFKASTFWLEKRDE